MAIQEIYKLLQNQNKELRMNKIHSLYFTCLLLLLSACKRASITPEPVPVRNTQNLLSRGQIDSCITKIINVKKDFRWADASEQVVWSALTHSGNTVSIGYKPKGWTNERVDAEMHRINIQSQEWKEAKKEILKLVWEEEKKNKPDLKIDRLDIYSDNNLPVVCIPTYSLGTIEKLRASELVRYVEPMGYAPFSDSEKKGNQLQSSSGGLGCNRANPYGGILGLNVDYKLLQPNSKMSWNYAYHNIPEAWKISTGKGIKVMVIDTGCSLNQENLQSSFNQGESIGRSVEHVVTLRDVIDYSPSRFYRDRGTPMGRRHAVLDEPKAPGDPCGHGTMMAGVVAAPRGTDGNACGVAYNCDLVTAKASEDVAISTDSEILGVIEAFNLAANREDIKIISMSMGLIFWDGMLADAIKKAANRGKLIFCAAGTTADSFTLTKYWGVIFPASMPEVLAVTGIKDNLKEICDVCHEGPEVDFVAVMQQSNKKFLSLALATSGDIPAVDGGSSVATAMMAGMAAIVWSKYPKKSASEILDILKKSSTNQYKNPKWGSGVLDVNKAVRSQY